MSLGGFIGALGDAFQARAREKGDEEDRAFKYANLRESIAGRQQVADEGNRTRTAMAEQTAAQRLEAARIRAEERKYESEIRAETAKAQQAIMAAYQQGKMSSEEANRENQRAIADINGRYRLKAAGASAASRPDTTKLRQLDLQRKALEAGISAADRKERDFITANPGVEDPGYPDPALGDNALKEYYLNLRRYLPLKQIRKEREQYAQKHRTLTEQLLSEQGAALSTPPPAPYEPDAPVAVAPPSYSYDTDPAFLAFIDAYKAAQKTP